MHLGLSFSCCTEPVPNRDPQTEVRTEPWILWTITPLLFIGNHEVRLANVGHISIWLWFTKENLRRTCLFRKYWILPFDVNLTLSWINEAPDLSDSAQTISDFAYMGRRQQKLRNCKHFGLSFMSETAQWKGFYNVSEALNVEPYWWWEGPTLTCRLRIISVGIRGKHWTWSG